MRIRGSRPRAATRGFFVRRAVTLLEVIAAVAVFLMVVALTAQILSQAGERALLIEHKNEALERCQAQMARVIAGVLPLTSQDYTAFDDSSDYQWKITADQDTIPGLYNVQIWVQHVQDGANSEVQLCQKVFDPKNRGSTADQPGQTGTTTPSSGTSGGN